MNVRRCATCGQDGVHHDAAGRPLIHTRPASDVVAMAAGVPIRRDRAEVCEGWRPGVRP